MNFTEHRLLPRLPEGDRLIVRCDDGRAFDVSVHDPASFNLMMLGGRDPIESAWVRRLVRPGDVVEIEALVIRLRSRMGLLKGIARVDGRRVVEGTMTFALGDPRTPARTPSP